MKKKHLSKQQLSRIRQNQTALTDNPSSDSDLKDSAGLISPAAPLGPERKGLVLTHFGQQLDIEALDGEDAGQIYRCFQRSNIAALVTGDQVVWQQGETDGIVVACQERSSLLQRPNKYNELKPVAANIDRIVIVISPVPEPHYNLIDRYLVAAEVSNIPACILLNKTDLLTPDSVVPQMLALYDKLGYETGQFSCKSKQGLDELLAMLSTHTSVFVGQSGVGKSALVNALLPDAGTKEGSLSAAADKGKHTTTSARLYHLPSGGNLIDSPGIREFGLWHMDTQEVIHGFIEFRPYLGQCKFRDCKHDNEAQCSILQALKDGHIDSRRFSSFQSICNSMETGFR